MFILLFGIGCFGLGYVVGWQGRTVVQATHTDTWTNVHILRRNAADSFTVSVDGPLNIDTIKFCADSAYAQFQPGSWLKFMTFERRDGCLSFAGPQLGFKSVWNADGTPVITLTEATLNEH